MISDRSGGCGKWSADKNKSAPQHIHQLQSDLACTKVCLLVYDNQCAYGTYQSHHRHKQMTTASQRCTTCHTMQPIDQFLSKSGSRLVKTCLRCRGKHRDAYVERTLSTRQDKVELLLQQLLQHGLVVPAVHSQVASSSSLQPEGVMSA